MSEVIEMVNKACCNCMKMYLITNGTIVIPIKRKQRLRTARIRSCAREALKQGKHENADIKIITKSTGFSPPSTKMLFFSI